MADEAEVTCPRCGATMEAGFILDTGYGHSSATTWVEGELGARPWTTQLEGRDRFVVNTYRCPGCGYLESYARTAE